MSPLLRLFGRALVEALAVAIAVTAVVASVIAGVDGGAVPWIWLLPSCIGPAVAAAAAWVASDAEGPAASLDRHGVRPSSMLALLSTVAVVGAAAALLSAPAGSSEPFVSAAPVPGDASSWPTIEGGWGPAPAESWRVPSTSLGWVDLVQRAARPPPPFAHAGRDRGELVRRVGLLCSAASAPGFGYGIGRRRGRPVRVARAPRAVLAALSVLLTNTLVLAIAGYSSTL